MLTNVVVMDLFVSLIIHESNSKPDLHFYDNIREDDPSSEDVDVPQIETLEANKRAQSFYHEMIDGRFYSRANVP